MRYHQQRIGGVRFLLPVVLLIALNQPLLNAQDSTNYHLVFDSNRDGNYDIYAMDVQGSNIRRLTDHPSQDFAPTCSPDGRFIAFTTFRDGEGEIYVMNADGTNQRNLTNHPLPDMSPAWSPDGEWIAFRSRRADPEGLSDIFIMSPDGSNLQNITDNPDRLDTDCAWSPDSQQMVLSAWEDGNPDLFIVSIGDGKLRKLVNMGFDDSEPAWSPDGQWIAFRPDELGIMLIGVDGRGAWNLTPAGSGDRHPACSPDGQWVAFASTRDGNYDVYVMDATGKRVRNVSRHPASDGKRGVAWLDLSGSQPVPTKSQKHMVWGGLKELKCR